MRGFCDWLRQRPSSLFMLLGCNSILDTFQVVKVVSQLACFIWPDDKHFIHIVEPAEGLVGRHLQSHFIKVLREELSIMIEERIEPIATLSI
jgi:hypothetical protein